jgi:hypothetical protein
VDVHKWIVFALALAPPIVQLSCSTFSTSRCHAWAARDLCIPYLAIGAEPQFPTIPTLDEWKNLWALWDAVTLGMIPPTMLHQKPIDLRHKCLFYLGHIPAYAAVERSFIAAYLTPGTVSWIFTFQDY